LPSSWTYWITVNERSYIYRLISSGFRLKNWIFSTNPHRKREGGNHLFPGTAHPGAHGPHPSRLAHTRGCVFVFSSVFFHETCHGTWNKISPLCNVFRGILNLHSLSFQVLTRCLLYQFTWFGLELHQNHQCSNIKSCLLKLTLKSNNSYL